LNTRDPNQNNNFLLFYLRTGDFWSSLLGHGRSGPGVQALALRPYFLCGLNVQLLGLNVQNSNNTMNVYLMRLVPWPRPTFWHIVFVLTGVLA
jgi:hypothetical protein